MDSTLIPYDSAEHFKTSDDQIALLTDALESGDAAYISHALGVVAKAMGMTNVERETGLRRQQLYRALSVNGNPTLATVTKVLQALGLKLKIETMQEHHA